MTALAGFISLAFVLAFVAAPFALLAVAWRDGRKSWRRFGEALHDVNAKLP